jgi:SAM-dependent methyltransferase
MVSEQATFEGFPDRMQLRADLEQWLTPAWAIEALIERHYRHLGAQDLVLDAGCGTGRWLRVLRDLHPVVRAIGVEVDPTLAQIARAHGCTVLEGDFRNMPLDVEPTLLIGNWPFQKTTFDGFLKRAHQILPHGGQAGVLTTSRAFQSTGTVLERMNDWSMSVELLPRELFGRYPYALVFVRFVKDHCRRLYGLALYEETDAARALKTHYRAVADEHHLTWRAVVLAALDRLGGRASLSVLYAEVEQVRPTANRWWREKVRQILQQHAVSCGGGVWAMA